MKDKYTFRAIKAELIIREAFELIGIPGSLLVEEQLEAAARSINFLMADLVNRNINLWTLKNIFLSLNPSQTAYTLPSNLIKVIQVDLRNSTRELFGTAQSTSGVAANAFDDNPATACTQTAINGSIGYRYNDNSPQNINFLGIRSMTTENYTITLQGSNDGINFDNLLVIPRTTYAAGTTLWFNVTNANSYIVYSIQETGGATLNINELYFNDQVVDTTLSELTNYDYLRMPQKNNLGRPTIFSVDYQIVPILNIWQAPQAQYKCLLVNYESMIETLTSYTESLNMPNSFYQTIVYGLAKSLAMKYANDKLQFIAPEFDKILNSAIVKNTNTLPISLRMYDY